MRAFYIDGHRAVWHRETGVPRPSDRWSAGNLCPAARRFRRDRLRADPARPGQL